MYFRVWLHCNSLWKLFAIIMTCVGRVSSELINSDAAKWLWNVAAWFLYVKSFLSSNLIPITILLYIALVTSLKKLAALNFLDYDHHH